MPFPDAAEEALLLTRIAESDTIAFEQLYREHWATLYKLAAYVLNDEGAAMDVVQDVFVWMWEQRTTVRIHSSLRAYLKTAVKYKIANYIRSGKIRQEVLDKWILTMPKTATTHDTAELQELKAIIHKTIESLPDKCREVFNLSRQLGLSNQEIADRLGISIKTVENHMTIALRRLRAHTREYMLLLMVAILSG